jgi:hypothetical protein
VTGPEHYREAEYMLQMATNQLSSQGDDGIDDANRLIARAQVHATLALAAATALDPAKTCTGGDWIAVAGVQS